MVVNVTGKHINVTDAIKQYAAERLQKLEKYFDHIHNAHVTVTLERTWHVVEVTLHADGFMLRGEERSADMYSSIDQVVEKLERQLKKYRDKIIHRPREKAARGAATVEPAEVELTPELEGEEAVGEGMIVRTKRFAIKPMTPEEAAMQMELLGHDFFVFSNSQTEQVNVLYRRRDGNYGLIEPEF